MKNILKKIVIILLFLFIMSFIIIEGLIINEGRLDDDINSENIDYIIVLGARLYGSTPSPALYERLNKAYEYAVKNKKLKIVVTGGQGQNENIAEAEAMKKFLITKGIQEDRIIKEDKSTSTYENLKFTKNIIEKINKKNKYKVLIITSDFHLFRSKFLAKRLGFKAYGIPAKTPESIKKYIYLREYAAVIKSFLLD